MVKMLEADTVELTILGRSKVSVLHLFVHHIYREFRGYLMDFLIDLLVFVCLNHEVCIF